MDAGGIEFAGRQHGSCQEPQHVCLREGEQEWTLTQALRMVRFGKFHFVLIFVLGVCFMADSVEVMLLSFLQEVLRDEWNLTPAQSTLV